MDVTKKELAIRFGAVIILVAIAVGAAAIFDQYTYTKRLCNGWLATVATGHYHQLPHNGKLYSYLRHNVSVVVVDDGSETKQIRLEDGWGHKASIATISSDAPDGDVNARVEQIAKEIRMFVRNGEARLAKQTATPKRFPVFPESEPTCVGCRSGS